MTFLELSVIEESCVKECKDPHADRRLNNVSAKLEFY